MEDKKYFYTNSVEVRSSFYDFILSFATKTPDAQGKSEIQDTINIMMSPQHAKTFLLILEQHIKKYEDSFGKIELPPGLLKQFAARQNIM